MHWGELSGYNRRSRLEQNTTLWNEKKRWDNLTEVGSFLSEYNDYPIRTYFKSLQFFLEDYSYKEEYYRTSLKFLKDVKTRLNKCSRFNYSTLQLSLKEFKWKDPEIQSDYSKCREHAYPNDDDETYEDWCKRKELYLSLVPAFLSVHPKSDNIDVSFLPSERNEYFAF